MMKRWAKLVSRARKVSQFFLISQTNKERKNENLKPRNKTLSTQIPFFHEPSPQKQN